MALDTTQQLGWAWEAAEGTDPIDAVNALYWHFGHRTTAFQDNHPTELKNWMPIYKDSTRNPSDAELPTSTVTGKIGFYPTNGIPLYMILGDSSSAGAPVVHTLNNINTGNLDTFTIRSETYYDASNFKGISAVGCKASSVSGFINLISDFKYLSEILTYNGLSASAAPTLNETHTTKVMHPTTDYTMTTANQKQGRYVYDTNTLFSWNTNDIIDDLTMFKYDIINTQQIFHVDNQEDTKYIDEGNYQFLLSFGLWRGNANTDAVWTDYKAGTQRDIYYL